MTPMTRAARAWRAGAPRWLLAAGLGAWAALPAVRADPEADTAAASRERAIVMERYIVSETRMEKNPWRYASVPGFEVLSRASNADTNWWLTAHQSGLCIENALLPQEWLPGSPVPYTLIIDDRDLGRIPVGPLQAQPMAFQPPADAFTWGPMSDVTMWMDRFQACDADTFAMNVNLHGVDTDAPAYATISLERLFRCTPPLPDWLLVGLRGTSCGLFRESFAPSLDKGYDIGHFGEERAVGPGTLWVSLPETRRLMEQFRKEQEEQGNWLRSGLPMPDSAEARGIIPPLQRLFAEGPPPAGTSLLWESEAALFVRWGLLGPGREDPGLSRAFLELVRRARREPVTEAVFADCFGFGYGEMEKRLLAYLRAVLAKPTLVYVRIPGDLPRARITEATADQVGRILGDWLRMQGNSLRRDDPQLGARFLAAAGRMLERAYRMDNGLPPDADPAAGGGRSASPPPNAAVGPAVVMRPFVVTAARIHDPGLLSVYGLYEHDIGEDAKAREWLEAAAGAGAGRPRAYLVLARLRLAEAQAHPRGIGGRLSAWQAASVASLLGAPPGRPPSAEASTLAVDAWSRCEAYPSENDIARVVEGVARFPRGTELAYRAALLCARGGYPVQACELAAKGLVFAVGAGDRARLERLLEPRASSAGPAPK